MTDEGVRKTLELNLHAMIYSNRAAVRSFLDRREAGAILNMGSVLGYSPAPHHFSTHVYAAAKSAAIGFTKSIAARYARDNIRCNVIAPALMETPMAIEGFVAAGQDRDELIARRNAAVPLRGQMGSGWDIANAALFLASDEAQFITGVLLPVDGGQSAKVG